MRIYYFSRARAAWPLALSALALSALSHANTQGMREYCVAGSCFPDLQKAEAFLRAEPNPATGRQFLERIDVDEVSQAPNVVHRYAVKDRQSVEHSSWWSAGVGPNCPDEPIGPTGRSALCRSSAQLKSSTEQYFRSINYCNVKFDMAINPITPFTGTTFKASGFGSVPSNRVMQVSRVTWPSSFSTLSYQWPCGSAQVSTGPANLGELVILVCPPLFLAKIGAPPSAYPNLCANYEAGTIVEKPKQYCTDTVGNPCSPATGQKIRHELDFDIEGLRLERHYHSLASFVSNAGLGAGWTHNFDSRITAVRSGSVYVIDEHGELDQFQSIGTIAGEQVYRSVNRSNQLLRQRGTPAAWELQVSSSQTNIYDLSKGRLEKVLYRDQPSNNLTLSYNSAGLLSAVSNAKGRQVRFEYIGKLLSDVHSPDGRIYHYSVSPNGLTAVQYPDQSVRSFSYDDPNFPSLLTGIYSETGRQYGEFSYDTAGRVVSSRLKTGSSTAPYAEQVSLVYQVGATEVTTALGERTNYRFSDGLFARATSVSDRDGAITTAFRSDGRADYRVDKRGVRTAFNYDAQQEIGRIEAQGADGNPLESESQERKVETSWDARLDVPLERRIYACSAPNNTAQACTSFGSARWVLKAVTRVSYNMRGQVSASCQIDPNESAALAYTCGSSPNPPTGVRQTRMDYCEASELADSASGCPILGQIKSVDGPQQGESDRTRYRYYFSDAANCAVPDLADCAYRRGDLRSVTNALGHALEYLKYDGAGRVLHTRDVNGVLTEMRYHPRGWLIERKILGANDALNSDDQLTLMDYWPNGLVKRVTQPDGSYLHIDYDDAQRVVRLADNSGNALEFTVDAAGNRTEELTKDPNNQIVRSLGRTYNTLSQLQTQKDAFGRAASFTYDASGNLDRSTDALLRTTDNDVDPFNRLSRTLQDINGVAAETKFSYDVMDNLIQVQDPKALNTRYHYNALRDLITLQSPDTGTTTYLYDLAGNRSRQTDARGVAINYSYDLLNRLTNMTYPTASLNVSYDYDSDIAGICAAVGENFLKGRLVRISDGSGSTQYCYDRFGNTTRKIQIVSGKSFTVRYQYAPSGRLTGVVYPDGTTVDYVRDAQGRIVEMGATPVAAARQVVLTGARYHPFGPVASWSYGNGRSMRRTLNANYQPELIETTSGGLNVGYEFDEVGNLKHLRGAAPNSAVLRVYDYDGLNRLTASKEGASLAVLEAYSYDKTGNRLSASQRVELPAGPGAGSGSFALNTTNYSYASTSHRLMDVGGTARTYDAAGHQLALGASDQPGGSTMLYTYNDQGRMSTVQRSGGIEQHYAYNGRGEQVHKYTASNDVYTVYDEAGRWLGDYDSSGAPTQQTIWLDDLPVALLAGAGRTQALNYLEPDVLGTPRTVIDPRRGDLGTVIWSWAVTGEAFGNTAPDQNPDMDGADFVFDMRFPGQRFDQVTKLNYNYFRDFESGTGRYVQSDPMGFFSDIATYGYVYGDPLNWSDKSGLKGKKGGGNFSSGRGGNAADRRGTTREFLRSAQDQAPPDLRVRDKLIGDDDFTPPEHTGGLTRYQAWCRQLEATDLDICGPGPRTMISCVEYECRTRMDVCVRGVPYGSWRSGPVMAGPNYDQSKDPNCRCKRIAVSDRY